jgi:uncharacterized protein YuzE
MSKAILNYDRTNDILYIVIREGEEHHFVEVAEDIVVEFDRDDHPIGIEIFNVSRLMVSAIGRERLTLATS